MGCFSRGTLLHIRSFDPGSYGIPRGSRYLIIKELGLKDHDSSGFWPKSVIIWQLDALG